MKESQESLAGKLEKIDTVLKRLEEDEKLRNAVHVRSNWLKQAVNLDGKVTDDEEWSDTTPMELELSPWHSLRQRGARTINATIWFKNDSEWLYLLYKIPWPAEDIDRNDIAYIANFWGRHSPKWEHSVLGGIPHDGHPLERRNYDNKRWQSIKRKSLPPRQGIVEGASTHDGKYYWFELRKKLKPREDYEWKLSLGKKVAGDVLVGFLDRDKGDKGIAYETYIHLWISQRSVA